MSINRVSIINFMGLILCFIPFTLLTGPFLPDLSITILCILFLFFSIREKTWFYFNNIFFIFFISFYIYLILSSLLSEYKLDSLQSSLFYFRFGIFALSVWFIISVSWEIPYRIFPPFKTIRQTLVKKKNNWKRFNEL